MDNEFLTGYHAAFTQYGIDKTSAYVNQAPFLSRMGRWLRKKAPSKTGIRNFLIGDPRRLKEEVVKGKAFRKGGLIRESFAAPGKLQKGLLYGVPTIEAGSIALDEKEDKAKRIGASLGGNIMGIGAFRPAGLLGSMGAYSVGENIGGVLGGTAGHLADLASKKNIQNT